MHARDSPAAVNAVKMCNSGTKLSLVRFSCLDWERGSCHKDPWWNLEAGREKTTAEPPENRTPENVTMCMFLQEVKDLKA